MQINRYIQNFMTNQEYIFFSRTSEIVAKLTYKRLQNPTKQEVEKQ